MKQRLVNWIYNFIKSSEEYISSSNNRNLKGIKRSIQLNGYTCGLHASYAILKYYNKNVSLEKVIKVLGTDENRTDTDPILETMRLYNLKVDVNEKADLPDIYIAINNNCPIIIL